MDENQQGGNATESSGQSQSTEAVAESTSPITQTSAFDDILSQGDSVPPSDTPTENTESAHLPENADAKPPVATDTAQNKPVEQGPIPYGRFKEKVEETNSLKAQLAQVEQFLDNKEVLQKYMQERFRETAAQVDPTILAQTKTDLDALDPLDPDFQQKLDQVWNAREEKLIKRIESNFANRVQEDQLVAQQEQVWQGVFSGRNEDRQKVETWVADWVDKNPGAKFPSIPGLTFDQNLRAWDNLVNGKQQAALESARRDAAGTEISKRVVMDSSPHQSQHVSTPVNAAFADMLAL